MILFFISYYIHISYIDIIYSNLYIILNTLEAITLIAY